MDGNNRWSKKNSQSKIDSYSKGAQKILSLSENIFKNYNVNYISAFALSNNNLNRAKTLINILKDILHKFLSDEKKITKINFQIIFLGDLRFLGKNLNSKIEDLEKRNKNKKHKLLIFLNYSGRKDIESTYKNEKINSLNKNNFRVNKLLLTKNLPDPEILIRTGGHQRISDFMLYQLAFTELFFLKKLWPDISNSDVRAVISKYKLINRKFGL
tara:strand:- start:589 stop:1230 length:642 start_codon:yes stop_codon:yes gene_type:complete